MAKDVLITPLDGLIQFSSSAGSGSGQIKVDGDDLVVSNLIGDVLLGDGASDIFIGDGTNNVDIVFEQNGEIRDDGSGKTITIGSATTTLILSSSSDITMQDGGGNVGIGTTTAGEQLEVIGNISASGFVSASAFGGDGSALTNVSSTPPTGTISSSLHIFSAITSSGNISASLNTTSSFGRGFFQAPNNNSGLALHASKDDATSNFPTLNTSTTFVVSQTANNGGFNGMTVLGGHSTGASIYKFGDKDNEQIGRFIYYHQHNRLDTFVNNTKAMSINSSQNVGIGTDTPQEKLTVFGNIDTSGSSGHISASGDISASGTITATQYGGNISGSATSTGSFGHGFFDSKVGIGTTSPDTLLHITGANNVNLLKLDGPKGDIVFKTNSTSGYTAEFLLDNTGMDIGHDSTARALNLVTGDSDRLTILGGGNVGIGTTSPTELLEINAGARIKVTPGSDLTGSILSLAADHDVLFSSQNDSATGDPQQFVMQHNDGHTELVNRRGNLILSSSADVNITAGGDDVIIQGADDVDILVQGGETAAKFGGNGGVDLYHNNVKKFSTAGGGIDVVGAITASGGISSSGDMTASGFFAPNAAGNITLGGIPGSVAGVHSSTDLPIRAVDDIFIIGGASGNTVATAKGDENIFLIQGSLQADGGITASGDISSSGDLYLGGNDIFNAGTRKIRFGSGVTLENSNGIVIFQNTDTSIASGDTYARFAFANSDCGEETAHIQVVATEAHNGADNGGSKYEFKAMANAADTSDSNNFSTIATLDPNGTSGHLNVNGNISASGDFILGDLAGGPFISGSQGELQVSGSGITIHNGSADGVLKIQRFSADIGQLSAGNTRFTVKALNNKDLSLEDDAGNVGVFVKDGGKVGIGATTTPTKALQVTGDISASGDIFVGESILSSSGNYLGNRQFDKTSTTDADFQGDVVYIGNSTTNNGKIYHYKSDGTWEEANADAVATSDGLLGVALGSNSTTHGILLRGMVTLDHDPGAVGDVLFISGSGGIASATAPALNNNVVRVIGYCLDASNGQIWFNPDNTFVEVSA